MMEVYDREDDVLQANISRDGMPVFAVSGLSTNIDLIVKIYAFNSEGRSRTKSLFIQALTSDQPSDSKY